MSTNGKGNGPNSIPSEADLASIAALLESDVPEELADKDLAELFVQLDKADSVAQGMEAQLDSLLERLDGMVEGLEGAITVKEVTEDGSGVPEAKEAVEDVAKKG